MIELYTRIANLVLENLFDKNLGFFDKSVGLEPENHNLPAKHYRRAILNQISTAKKSGKRFAWGREGGVAGRDREQLAQRIAKRLGVKMKGFNLEHPNTDIENDKSRIMRKLRRMTGSPEGAEGARSSFLGGQGDPRYRTEKGDKWLQSQGIDPENKDAQYRANFGTEDYGDKPGLLNKTQKTINKVRREGVRRIISNMKKQGYHVGGTYGEGHFEKEKEKK